MLINTVDSLVFQKQYVNLPTVLINKIRQLFGPSLASAWEVFYAESRCSHGVFTKTYDYLANKIGCSRRTVIRYIKRMVEAGIIIVNKRYHHRCSLENEFILLAPDEVVLASKDSKSRLTSMDIDYSIDYLVENYNYVDKSVTSCHPSILDLNQDINNTNNHSLFANRERQLSGNSGQPLSNLEITEPKTAITGCRQEENQEKLPVDQNRIYSKPTCIPKSVPNGILNRIEKLVAACPGVSNPSELVQEALYFVTHRKESVDPWRAVGAFGKLLGKNGCGGWSTPWGMRRKK